MSRPWLALALCGGLPLLALQETPSEGAGQAPDKPTEAIRREDCVTSKCHSEVKAYAALHGPLYVNACDSCHELTDAKQHSFTMAREKSALCLRCHELDGPDFPGGAVTHAPLERNECLPCHNPHGGATPSLLRGNAQDGLCVNCHADKVQGRQYQHGPVAANDCAACHEPHESAHAKLLIAEGRELCLACHITIAKQLENPAQVHAPVLDGCQTCHDPHATQNDALLPTDRVTLCTSCHEDIRDKLDRASTPHAAVVTERACLNCHDPHASPNPRLLRQATAELCFECHDRVLERPGGGQIANIKALVEGKRSLHGPVAEKNCVACHEIHGSSHPRLLTSNYSDQLYQAFDASTYEMCFTCHDRQSVLLPQTDAVTAFRNGATNLHFVHVNRAKGRACTICHDAHAADADHHIREAVPFGPGGWMLPIDWTPTESGGTCSAACHGAYGYDREKPVLNPIPTPKIPPRDQ